jgi:hypothetical protein
MLRPRSFLTADVSQTGTLAFNAKAVRLVVALLIVVAVLTAACILLPVFAGADRSGLRAARPFLLFFGAIGLGFMLVEIAVMQRLSIFLGHPVYGLSVMLFSLLLSSGLGSLSTTRLDSARQQGAPRLFTLLAALVLFGALLEPAIRLTSGLSTPRRIATAVLLIAPMGFFMGMAFPLGMKAALSRAAGLTPWLWGINGATSVCASVGAMVIALSFGTRAAFWTGFACYAVAAAAFIAATRLRPSPPAGA